MKKSSNAVKKETPQEVDTQPAPTASDLAAVAWIVQYLCSKLFKGIGPILANKIIARFGLKTVEIIEKSIHKLRQIKGIGTKRIKVIEVNWQSRRAIRQAVVFLQGLRVDAASIPKIIDFYGSRTVEALKENPYRLLRDIKGIGFLQADKIALKLAFPRDSELRIQEGILYILRRAEDQGHTYQPWGVLIKRCTELLAIKGALASHMVYDLASHHKIVIDKASDGKAIYLPHLYRAEAGAAEHLIRILKGRKSVPGMDIDKILKKVELDIGITLEDEQCQAVKEAVNQKTLIITGGPGVGKSTVITAIINIYEGIGKQVILGAPTGRAAKRMTEITGHEASTIHRLLESNVKGRFEKNEHNRLKGDVMIVDEFSMVDSILLDSLLRAVPTNMTLMLVGDPDQLPSVGPGSVLRELLASEKIPTVKLRKILRQADGSQITKNAHRIKEGRMPIMGGSNGITDFYLFGIEESEQIVDKIVSCCKEWLQEKFGFDPVKDVQIISPTKKGYLGTNSLNDIFQPVLNPPNDNMENKGLVLWPGDKVMQTKNNYQKGVYNGDIGMIQGIDTAKKIMTIDFGNRLVDYSFSEQNDITLAYAVTIHKSQGSEYPVVIIPLHLSHGIMLQRNLLYTAITRGKRLVIVIGGTAAIERAVTNDGLARRYSHLAEKIQESYQTEYIQRTI